ncbi:MAG: cytochrome c [Rhodobiaceae bacterium]|nr:cytochrome c [Rhodobiaceae bacterium]MCC0052564.1 cytochrome c [Rhodobiaceae bacterium]
MREALAVLVALFASPALAGQPADAPDAAQVAALTNLVKQDCGSCHGMTLKGGLGKPLTAEHMSGYDIEVLSHIVLEGIPGTAMPGWKGILSAEDADWIARNLKSGALE